MWYSKHSNHSELPLCGSGFASPGVLDVRGSLRTGLMARGACWVGCEAWVGKLGDGTPLTGGASCFQSERNSGPRATLTLSGGSHLPLAIFICSDRTWAKSLRRCEWKRVRDLSTRKWNSEFHLCAGCLLTSKVYSYLRPARHNAFGLCGGCYRLAIALCQLKTMTAITSKIMVPKSTRIGCRSTDGFGSQ